MSKKNKARIPVKSKQNELPLKSKRKIDWMIITIIALCFILYSNTIPNRYAMDDEMVTSSNTMVAKGIRAIPEIWTSFFGDGKLKYEYRSIVKTTYTIEHQLLGVNPNVRYFMGNKKMLL